jgi:PGF-pre-PGF domain-containing protein
LEIGTNFITATAANNNSEHKESNTIEITRKEVTTPIRRSGGGGGSSGRSSLGSVGTSGENHDNILISETQREFVNLGENVSYHFNADGNIIMNLNFTGLITAGIIPAKVEILNHTSSLVNYTPLDTVYKNVNILVGNLGWATSKNIANSTISFKVDKSWVNENNIDTSSIRMNRFFNGQWNPLPTYLRGQDDEFFYFICETQGFSPFAVTGKSAYIGEAGAEGITVKPSAVTENETLNNFTAINTSAQEENGNGLITVLVFGLLTGLVILLIAVLSRKK